MDKESYSWGGIGFLALFFLIIIAFWGRGGNGFGWGNNGFGLGALAGADLAGLTNSGFKNFDATCEAEKATMRDTARTQFGVIEQAQLTRETVQATASATQAKIDFYAYQDLRDKLSESQRENMMLQNKLFVKDQLAPLTASIADIRCNMLVRPNITGIGAVCPNAGVLNGLGIDRFGGGCGCGCGNNVLV